MVAKPARLSLYVGTDETEGGRPPARLYGSDRRDGAWRSRCRRHMWRCSKASSPAPRRSRCIRGTRDGAALRRCRHAPTTGGVLAPRGRAGRAGADDGRAPCRPHAPRRHRQNRRRPRRRDHFRQSDAIRARRRLRDLSPCNRGRLRRRVGGRRRSRLRASVVDDVPSRLRDVDLGRRTGDRPPRRPVSSPTISPVSRPSSPNC